MPFDAVVVFAKLPEAGKVKTRLGAVPGPEGAARLYGLFLQYLSWRLRRLPRDLRIFVAVDPPEGLRPIRRWFPYLPGFQVFPQRGRGLGARMLNATREAKARGARKVLLIGSDCLEISIRFLKRALGTLDRKDLVLGPAQDGGYYLIGWKKPIPGCLQDVAWSGPKVFRKTVLNARKLKVTISALTALSDVDEWKDWEKALKRLDSRNPVTRLLRDCSSDFQKLH